MASVIHRCIDKNWISPPKWVKANNHFEVWTGSVAYGCSNDASDMDVYAWVMPPKGDVFPHLKGHITGFGEPYNSFSTWQQHHIADKEKSRTYDVTLFSVVHFFNLCMQNNPNMIDCLFVPRRCILHSTSIGEYVRDHRHEFLHKGCWHRFRGYAASQMTKIRNKNNSSNPKRAEYIEKFGYDVKFASHLVRLLLEVEQILSEEDLTLDRNADVLKSIRNGEWSFERLEEWSTAKEKSLELVFANSKLRDYPNEEKLKELMLNAMEQHYGTMQDAVVQDKSIGDLLADLEGVIGKYRL